MVTRVCARCRKDAGKDDGEEVRSIVLNEIRKE